MTNAELRAAAERLVALGQSPAPGGTWRPSTSSAPRVAEAYLRVSAELAEARAEIERPMDADLCVTSDGLR